ncbi:MAG: cupin domain-containing protein, partial [Clostridiales bacterium]|nr:cupin domain-containing protein [Clostridiales bacterium]
KHLVLVYAYVLEGELTVELNDCRALVVFTRSFGVPNVVREMVVAVPVPL